MFTRRDVLKSLLAVVPASVAGNLQGAHHELRHDPVTMTFWRGSTRIATYREVVNSSGKVLEQNRLVCWDTKNYSDNTVRYGKSEDDQFAGVVMSPIKPGRNGWICTWGSARIKIGNS